MPVKVLASRGLGTDWQEYHLTQRRPPVVLPGEPIGLCGIGQWAGNMNAQSPVDREHAGIEGHIMRRTGSQAVAGIEALGRRAVLPRLDMPGQQHPGAAERRGPQPAKDTPAAAVSQYLTGEHMLSDPGRRQEDPLRLQLRPRACATVPADLVAQARFEHGYVKFLLAEQSELAAVLQPQEVRQAGRVNAVGTGGEQQYSVDGAEPCWIVAEHGTSEDIPPGAVRMRAVQVGHFRQHTGRRSREQPGQRRHRLWRLMCGAPAIMPMFHQERSGEAEQRLDRQKCNLPAALNRTPRQKHPELITGLADR